MTREHHDNRTNENTPPDEALRALANELDRYAETERAATPPDLTRRVAAAAASASASQQRHSQSPIKLAAFLRPTPVTALATAAALAIAATVWFTNHGSPSPASPNQSAGAGPTANPSDTLAAADAELNAWLLALDATSVTAEQLTSSEPPTSAAVSDFWDSDPILTGDITF